MEMAGYWDFMCNTAAGKRNVPPTRPWALLREQSAGAEFLLCEARLHS